MKNQIYNALGVTVYIILLVSFVFYVVEQFESEGFNIIIPIIMLSLFVLSASVMGYLFLAKPLMLYFDGKKKKAVSYFFKTVLSFEASPLLLWQYSCYS